MPSLLTPSGDLHPLATLALHDLFRRLDTLTLDGTLSLAELTTFFTRLSLPFTQDTYHALLRAHCPGHSEHGLDRRAFCEWWRQEALIRGEASDVMRWLEAWGYTRGEAWPCEARCVMVSMQSMDPVAVRIGTERGEDALVSALATAGLIGAVVAERASLSGAEGGCQAETGAAAGMAAGAATEMLGGTPSQVGHAVALAQQATLGLICDPLGGLVELPCVFRNATGAAIAMAAIEMAPAGVTFAIPADEVIDVMGEIGREMDVRYRETAGGGLAATPTGRRLARARLVQIKRSDA